MKKKENSLLLILLIISLMSIFLIKFIFNEIPEMLSFGSELGEITYNLSLAYISSYIFYQIVVVIPKNRDLKNIYSIAKSISYGIVYRGSQIIKPKHSIKDSLDITDVSKEIKKEEFKNICLSINIYDTFDFKWTESDISKITYLEHLKKIKLEILKESYELFRFISHLETEHIKLINDIIECPFMSHGQIYLDDEKMLKNRETLEFIYPMLFDFYTKIRKLNNYINQIKL